MLGYDQSAKATIISGSEQTLIACDSLQYAAGNILEGHGTRLLTFILDTAYLIYVDP